MEEDFDRFFEELKKFSEVVYPESARAAVIVGASQMDVELEKLIQKALRPSDEKDDELFENDRGLGTFSAKINMAYRLGLIDKDFKRALHVFRKIRNGFSHQVHGCDLHQQPYSNWLREVVGYCKDDIDINFDEALSIFPSNYKSDENTDSIKIAITFILGKLSALVYWARPLWENPWKNEGIS